MSDVDLDRLADFVGGALDGTPEEARVRRLIADDPAWTDAYARLVEADALVATDLRMLAGASQTMPAEVAARLSRALGDALATEGPERSEKPAAPAETPTLAGTPTGRHSRLSGALRPDPGTRGGDSGAGIGPGRSGPHRDGAGRERPRRGGRRRWAAVAAVAVVGLAGVTIAGVTSLGSLDGRGSTTRADAPDRDAAGGAAKEVSGGLPAMTASGRDYTRTTLASAAGSLANAMAASGSDSRLGPPAAGPGYSGPDSRADAQRSAGTHGSTDAPRGAVSPGPAAPGVDRGSAAPPHGPAALDRLTAPDALTSCLGAITASHGRRVSAVDFARFEGAPALVVVLAEAPQAPGARLVVVAGPACGIAGSPDERYVTTG